MIRVRAVRPLEAFRVRLAFTDGSERDIDLSPYLRGPIFESIRRDPGVFETVSVDSALGTIVWPNGADVDPDVLFWGRTPAWAEDEATTASEQHSR